MKDTKKNVRLVQTNESSTQKKQFKPSKQVVLIRRGEGQSWEEYKKACIDIFRKAGLLQD